MAFKMDFDEKSNEENRQKEWKSTSALLYFQSHNTTRSQKHMHPAKVSKMYANLNDKCKEKYDCN